MNQQLNGDILSPPEDWELCIISVLLCIINVLGSNWQIWASGKGWTERSEGQRDLNLFIHHMLGLNLQSLFFFFSSCSVNF